MILGFTRARQPCADLISDLLPSEGQRVRVAGCRGVEVIAVGCALDVDRHLRRLRERPCSVVGDAKSVPGIDSTGGEQDVGASNVYISIVLVDPIHLCIT